MDYASYRQERNRYWSMIRCARSDYKPELGFYAHLQQEYGLAVELDHSGNLTQDYTILDDAKYTLFLLKYSK